MFIKTEKQNDGMFRSVNFRNMTYGETHVLLHALQNYPSPEADKMALELQQAMIDESMLVPTEAPKH